ncbi:MAG: ion channel [Gammaproteobacteria bacterium]
MFFVMSITVVAMCIVVSLHHEVLTHLTAVHFRRGWSNRLLLPSGMLLVIFTHIAEIWIFAVAYKVALTRPGSGGFAGPFDFQWVDFAYFSFVSYTTLGYGEIVPTGGLRFMAGTEAIVGLVLIAWSASFSYLQMERTMLRVGETN